MAKASKNRDCPALQTAIPTWQCGSERISKIDCPHGCPHNPFSAENYSALGEIESEMIPVMNKRIWDSLPPGERRQFLMEMDQAENDPFELTLLIGRWLYHERDPSGLSIWEKWKQEGFPGLVRLSRAHWVVDLTPGKKSFTFECTILDLPEDVPYKKAVVLGSIVLSMDKLEIEAQSAANAAKAKQLVLTLLQDALDPTSESSEVTRPKRTQKNYDSRFVVPRFLEDANRYGMETYYLAGEAPLPTVEQAQKEWLDTPRPVLDNLTPREASRRPELRGELLRVLKGWAALAFARDSVGMTRAEADADVDAMLHEMGIHDFDPPPLPPDFDLL